MKKRFVTMKRLRTAIHKVEREMQSLGLWVSGMEDTQVFLTPIHLWYGWATKKGKDIFIPRLSLSTWIEQEPWTLEDVLRHEYSHILAARAPKNFRAWPRDRDRVSSYALTNKAEDIAETAKYFIKHKGKLPKKWRHRDGIIERWQYLQALTAVSSAYFSY